MTTTTSAPILPIATVARVVADLQARGRTFRLNPNGTLSIRPRPSGRERALIAANRAAVVALLGLSPDPPADTSGDDWQGAQRSTWCAVRSAGDILVTLADLGSQDFTFGSIFPKQVRS